MIGRNSGGKRTQEGQGRSETWGRGRSRGGPGGGNGERVPVRRTRRVGGPAVAGTLSAIALAAGAFAVTVAGPAATAGATGTHAKTVKVSTARVAKIGTVLTTSSGLTLYRFTEDPVGSSVCTGACAKIWPPFFAAKGSHISGPKGVKGLSLMKVGSHWQVAFHKVALYRFADDKKKGQAKGQDVGGLWFAVLKSGIPASTAAGAASTPTTSASSSVPTTQPVAPTTQAPRAVTPTTMAPGAEADARADAGHDARADAGHDAPPTPTPTTPPTSPPTTPTTSAGSGGVSF